MKKNDMTSAIKWYEKSLIEHRTADVLNKLKEVRVRMLRYACAGCSGVGVD